MPISNELLCPAIAVTLPTGGTMIGGVLSTTGSVKVRVVKLVASAALTVICPVDEGDQLSRIGPGDGKLQVNPIGGFTTDMVSASPLGSSALTMGLQGTFLAATPTEVVMICEGCFEVGRRITGRLNVWETDEMGL